MDIVAPQLIYTTYRDSVTIFFTLGFFVALSPLSHLIHGVKAVLYMASRLSRYLVRKMLKIGFRGHNEHVNQITRISRRIRSRTRNGFNPLILGQ
jgi:hypothetical protein